MQLIKHDPLFERKVVLLHNEWNLPEGRMLFSTSIESQRFVRWASKPPSMHQAEPLIIPGVRADGGDLTQYPHEETSVGIDTGYCSYLIFFRSDGTVESAVFA